MIRRFIAVAGLLAPVAAPAAADQCTNMQLTTTTMCLSAQYSVNGNNRFTVTFGPGTGFSGVGASKGIRGVTFQGTYTCQGNNFYTTSYSVSDGEQNYWIAQFPNTMTGSGSQGQYFDGKLKVGSCP